MFGQIADEWSAIELRSREILADNASTGQSDASMYS
jgi:hypothetical protein